MFCFLDGSERMSPIRGMTSKPYSDFFNIFSNKYHLQNIYNPKLFCSSAKCMSVMIHSVQTHLRENNTGKGIG